MKHLKDKLIQRQEYTQYTWNVLITPGNKSTRWRESESEFFLENTIQLHYSIEANRSMDADNRNKPSRHFFEGEKKKQLTCSTRHSDYFVFARGFPEKASSPDNQNIKMAQQTFSLALFCWEKKMTKKKESN